MRLDIFIMPFFFVENYMHAITMWKLSDEECKNMCIYMLCEFMSTENFDVVPREGTYWCPYFTPYSPFLYCPLHITAIFYF